MPVEPASRDSWKANFLVNTERWLLKYPSQHTDFTPAQYSHLIALGSLSTDTSNTQIHSVLKEKCAIEVQMRSWVQPAAPGPWSASYCPSRKTLAKPHSHSFNETYYLKRAEGRGEHHISAGSQREVLVVCSLPPPCAAKALRYFSEARVSTGELLLPTPGSQVRWKCPWRRS